MIFFCFLPLILFIFLYFISGIYFSSFYTISPVMLIIPSIAFSIWKEKNSYEKFIAGIQNKDVLAMCIIFLLSGAFTSITSEIKSIDSVINIVLYFIQPKYLLISIFLTSAFLSTAIGILLASKFANLSPLIIFKEVYFCYTLFFVMISYLIFSSEK